MNAPSAIDLDVDLGELADEPPELYRLATLVNVACGGHAGDAASMARAVELARASGARLAAHPSYPDRDGFGRRAIAIAPEALRASVAAQVGVLAAAARAGGARLDALKAHGALYHDAARDPALARLLLDASLAAEPSLALVVGPPGGALEVEVAARGLAYAREGFADRGYAADGSLLPRGAPGALLVDPGAAADQALALAARGDVGAICVHGDGPNSVAVARAVRDALTSAGRLRGAT